MWLSNCLRAVCAALLLSATALAQPVPAPAVPAPAGVPKPQVQPSGPSPIPAAPTLPVKSYITIDFDTGSTLAEQAADLRVEPASITKIMAAYVVFHELRAGRLKLEDQVTISEKAWRMEGSRMFAKVGDQIPVEQLVLGMIVQSGNDSTVALAEHIAGSEEAFVALMNNFAAKIGLAGTNFSNAAGLPDAQHYSTARDIATLARTIITEFPDYYRWYAVREYTWNNIRQYNRNQLLARDASVDGMKTGHTESAGYCLVSSAKRGDMRLIAVVMGSESESARTSQSQTISNYGFRFFETHQLYAAGAALSTPLIWKGELESLPVGIAEPLRLVIPRGHYERLNASMELVSPIVAPIAKGATLGKVRVRLGKELLAERNLIALEAGVEGGFFANMGDSITLWWRSE